MGKKLTALFQTYNWDEARVLSVFAEIYANTWQGGTYMPPPSPNRVNNF